MSADAPVAAVADAWDYDDIVRVGERMPDVVSVKVIAPLAIFVRFDDGLEGIVRFEEERLRGVQLALENPDYFAGVHISSGAVTWPDDGYDMCPDTMWKEIVAGGGEWVVTQPFKHDPEVTNGPRWIVPENDLGNLSPQAILTA